MGKKDFSHVEHFVFVCSGSDCKPDSKKLQKAFKETLDKHGLKKSTTIIKTKCTGRCKEAPVVIVGNEWVGEVTPADTERLVQKHLLNKE